MKRSPSRDNKLSSTTYTRELIVLRLLTVLVLNTLIYLLTMDGNITRCIDGQPHFVPAYVYNRQLDVRPNHNSFTAFSTQDQHGVLLLSGVEPVQIFWVPVWHWSSQFQTDVQVVLRQSRMGSMEQPRITVKRPLAQAHLPFGAGGQTFRCRMTTLISNPAYEVAPRFGTTRRPTAR